MKTEWFASWFDSNYYHQLYKHRNDEEAKLFINNIVAHLQLQQNATVIDVACGKGRHSIMLAEQGLQVTGVDLSANSITYAKQFETKTLQFAVHDMRNVLCSNYYDAVFNLFTSFGYFNTSADNANAARALSIALKPQGFLVIDFLNVPTAMANINNKPLETIVEGAVTFKIARKFENNKFCKQIEVWENNELVQQHIEQVSALVLADFEQYFSPHNMQLQNTFGNYALEPHTAQSPRLIMVFKKNIK